MELACSVLALKNGELPGTLNHTKPDPACPVAVHTGAPRPIDEAVRGEGVVHRPRPVPGGREEMGLLAIGGGL